MSYQVLARKWRPRNFSTLVGQEHVVRALTHALNEKRLHHAYLFTGTRGVGKTTIARILAKSLNCETGVSATPCGQCSACQEIDAGRFVDLLEVDAATNTRVEEMRQLLENAIYAPTRGRYKVYVIDEVHMLSSSAFNAMLKTLEEPPEHVKFILATTDPQKIPVTVLSRCLQFNLKQMPVVAIVEHLGRILKAEEIPFEGDALGHIARAAEGSMRDALSLLDQAIAHGGGKIEVAMVSEMLGTVDAGYLLELLEALARGEGEALVAVADVLQTRGLSCGSALQELAVLLTRLQLLQLVPNALGNEGGDMERLTALSRSFSPEFVQLAYQIVTQGRQELALAPDEYSGFVMVLLRLLAFVPLGQEVEQGSARQAPRSPAAVTSTAPGVMPRASLMPERKASSAAPASIPERVAAPVASVRRVMMPVEEASPMPDYLSEADSNLSTDTFAPDLDPEFEVPSRVFEAPPEPYLAARPQPLQGGEPDWHALVEGLALTGMTRELAQHCDFVSREGALCTLRLAPAHRFLLSKQTQEKLQAALAERLGQAGLMLTVEVAEIERTTPAQAAEQNRRARHESAVAAIEQDATVQDFIETLDASLVEASIKPIA